MTIKDGLRVGGVYRTRDGREITIVSRENFYSAYYGHMDGLVYAWEMHGRHANYSSLDLIEEVTATDQPKVEQDQPAPEKHERIKDLLMFKDPKPAPPDPITPRLWLAGMMAQGLLASANFPPYEHVAQCALKYADALLSASKGEANG